MKISYLNFSPSISHVYLVVNRLFSFNTYIKQLLKPMEDLKEKLEEDWVQLLNILEQTIGKRPSDLNSVLFLIGVQELGKGPVVFTKEQKQDLMHIATCKVLSLSGFYELEGLDTEGWPHWRLIEKLPHFNLVSQETLLKIHVIKYFKEDMKIYQNQ